MMFLLIVTLTSMLLAAIMSVIAWRIAGDEGRRSEARVAALSAEIHDVFSAPVALFAQAGASRRADAITFTEPPRLKSVPAIPRGRQHWDEELELRPAECAASAYTNLFAAQRAPSGARPFAVLAIGALVLCAAVASAMLLGGRFSHAPRTKNPAVVVPAALPLELVALGHERDGDRLTVRGVLRNPPSGAEMDRLTAVVFLFTPDGGFLTSGRAAIESPALRPGGESTFIVSVPGAGDVGRYRVSFRTDDRIVPHVDRRHES
jgi:hypothetical protein